MLSVGRESVFGKGGTRDGGGEVGAEWQTTDEAGSKGSEVETAPASQDVNDVFRTCCVDAGIVGAGADMVDIVSLMSGLTCGASISCCALPSRGRENGAARGIFFSAVATAPGGNVSVGHGLV